MQPNVLATKLKTELNNLEKQIIIEKINEPKKWCSNLVIIEKDDKTLKLCIDPIDLKK